MNRMIIYVALLVTVFLGGCSKEPENQRLIWSFKTDDVVPTCPTFAPDGTIYIGSHDFHLYSINKDGKMNWRFKTGDFVHGTPALDHNGNIYFGSFDGCAYALTPEGKEIWRFKTEDKIESSPAIGSDD
ncbi:MAG: PQQ-binding-like beta-propeller repeat protein, partial [Planctomycetota bacterium]